MREETAISEKMLQVSMPDGSVYHMSCNAVASIAASLAARRCRREGGNAEAYFQENYAKLVGDEQHLLAAAAQLDWEEVEGEAVRVKKPSTPDYGIGWLSGEKRVVGPRPQEIDE